MTIKDIFKRDLIRPKEAARLIEVTPQTIRNWYTSGKIKKYEKKGRPEIFVSKKEILEINEIEESKGLGS